MDCRDLLTDGFGRLPGLVHRAVDGLTTEQLAWAPADGANTVGWLVWHLTRIQDHHVSELLDTDQVWLDGDRAARFGLEPDSQNTGYGHDRDDIATVRPESTQALVEYYGRVSERTMAFVSGVTGEELDRVVDRRWDPPVTLGVRLMSVLGDDLQHVGQAAYLRGLLR